MYQTDSGLDQPASDEQRLAEKVAAIGVARGVRLAREVERLVHAARAEDIERLRAIHIELKICAAGCAGPGVDATEQRLALGQSLGFAAQGKRFARRLESGEVSLEESMELYEEGMKLIEFCSQQLETAEKKVLKLSKTAGGTFRTEALDEAGEGE